MCVYINMYLCTYIYVGDEGLRVQYVGFSRRFQRKCVKLEF